MFTTVANDKGGVTKTTTAVHIAAYFQTLGVTRLIDKDPIGSAPPGDTRANCLSRL